MILYYINLVRENGVTVLCVLTIRNSPQNGSIEEDWNKFIDFKKWLRVGTVFAQYSNYSEAIFVYVHIWEVMI